MSGNSAIEWTHMTWNPLAGCTRVTAGCDHCFAFALHDSRHTIYQRNAGWWSPGGSPMPAQYGRPFSEIQLLPDRLMQPLHQMRPKMIFVNSMSDLFQDGVSDDYIKSVADVMRQANWHIFQVSTVWPSGSLDGDLMVLTPPLTRYRRGLAAPRSASGGRGGGSATSRCRSA